MERKGQVTIFIIIAIVIVVLGLLLYFFFPKIQSTLSGGATNPQIYISECIEEEIEDVVEQISLHGGKVAPEFFSVYDGIEIRNLCYTEQYCTLCTIQEPQLASSIEWEIKNEIDTEVEACFNSLKESYERKGYEVNLKSGPVEIELLPKKILSTFNYSLTLTKEEVETYDSFSVVLDNNLYELVAITNSILKWERTYGRTDVTLYMDLYPTLKIEQKLLGDDTTVYILTDRNDGSKFEFASRSLVFAPSGYC